MATTNDDDTTRGAFLAFCQTSIDQLEPETEFVLAELLGPAWAKYSVEIDPKLLGNLFSDAVKDGTIKRVARIGIRNSGRDTLWRQTG